jgi:hypothetical protein
LQAHEAEIAALCELWNDAEAPQLCLSMLAMLGRRGFPGSGTNCLSVGGVMFKRFGAALAVLFVALSPVIGASPAGAPSKNDVVAQATKAVEFYRTNGREKTLAEIERWGVCPRHGLRRCA